MTTQKPLDLDALEHAAKEAPADVDTWADFRASAKPSTLLALISAARRAEALEKELDAINDFVVQYGMDACADEVGRRASAALSKKGTL
jgi:hypothetical protein